MIPNVTKSGSSFKGAAAYYLHDKREAGEDERTTTERVDWTATRGLATDDPELAIKIMAATAMDQDRLKKEAGIKNTGRKSADSVYAYSLAWHPDEAENIDKAEMLKAADESLKAIGAQDHQAVIVAHNDEPHPHVHVILNRVSPEDGKMLTKSNDFRKLESWALDYRIERGEELLYCPARVKKAEAIQQKKDGQKVDFVRGDKNLSRQQIEAAKGLSANDNDTRSIKDVQNRKDADLAAYGKKMHSRHSNEWEMLSQRYQAQKAQVMGKLGNGKTPYQQAAADVRAQFKPLWSELGKQQWQETKDFERREKRLGGKFENALKALKIDKDLGEENSRGIMSKGFNFALSSKARAAALQKLHSAQKRNLSAAQNAEIGAAISGVKKDQAASMKSHRATFSGDRQGLIGKQAAERADLQRKWGKRKIERNRAFEILRKKETLKKEAKATPEATRGQQRAQFNKAARAKRKRKGRSRTRDPE